MGDVGSSRMFSISRFESFGKGEERKRFRCSCSSRRSYEAICSRMDEAFEGGFEAKAPKRSSSCPRLPLKSSRSILLETVGSAKISRAGVEIRGRYVRKSGAFFERALNTGHALMAPGINQTQSRGKSTATSFQSLQIWRKLNVRVLKFVSLWRPASTM